MHEHYQKRGYQVVRQLIPADVVINARRLLEENLSLALERMKDFGIGVGTTDMVPDINALLSGPDASDLDRDLRVLLTGHFPLEVRLDRRLWEIPRDAGVQDFLKTVLGTSSMCMHMPPTARFVLPGNLDAGVPSHQDISYNRHMSDFFTCWVPLVDIDETCGGVTVFPGSDGTVVDASMVDHGIWFGGIDVSKYKAVDCVPMAPGDVLIFNKYLAHKSMPNVSDKIRFSLDYRFFAATETSTKHYLDMDEWKVIDPDG